MRSRNLLFLYVQRVRAHPLQELLALIGIAVGVALVFAVQVANTSVVGSVDQLVRGITGPAQLRVTARDLRGFDARTARQIAQLPGVQAAAPLIDVRVQLRGRGGTASASLLGGDRRLVQIGGALLRQFAGPQLRAAGLVALPRPLARAIGAGLGDTIAVSATARTHRVTIGTVLTADDIGALARSPILLAPLAEAQRLSDLRGRVTSVLVVARPHRVAQVRAALRRLAGERLNVTAGDAEARLLRQASAPNDQSTALFAAISALVGLLFAFNAMLLTVPERRRFLADLRLEGLGDLTVVWLVLFDALVLGIAACALGLALGDELSSHAFHAAPGYLSFAFSIGDQRIVDARSVALAVAGGMLATLLAAMRPLADLLSRRPLDDIYREDDERDEDTFVQRGWIVAGGILLIAAAAVVLVLLPSATAAGIALLVGGMVLSLPALLALALRAFEALSHRSHSPVLIVALGELRATTTRSLALAATGALAVFGSVAVEGAHADLQRALDGGARQLSAKADLWAMPPSDADVLATDPFPPGRALAAAASVPGVRAVRAYRGGFLDVGDRRVWVVAPPRSDPEPVLALHLRSGSLALATRRLRGHGWVALSHALVARQRLRIGDTVTLPTPRSLPLRLAAVLTNMGWSSGAAVLNASDYRRAWGSSDVTELGLLLAPSASPARVAAQLRRALGSRTGLTVETPQQREQRFRAKSRQGLSRLTQIATLVLIAAALALAAALGGVIWSRRPRLTTLKLSGFSDGEVWRALVLESAIVLGIGCAIGALFGLAGQYMLTRWLSISTDFPTEYTPAGLLALATLLGVTLVAVAMAALPGYLAARVEPTPAAPGQ
jgi:putative ABC transport system permease protein